MRVTEKPSVEKWVLWKTTMNFRPRSGRQGAKADALGGRRGAGPAEGPRWRRPEEKHRSRGLHYRAVAGSTLRFFAMVYCDQTKGDFTMPRTESCDILLYK